MYIHIYSQTSCASLNTKFKDFFLRILQEQFCHIQQPNNSLNMMELGLELTLIHD